jgi:hypothetical protein
LKADSYAATRSVFSAKAVPCTRLAILAKAVSREVDNGKRLKNGALRYCHGSKLVPFFADLPRAIIRGILATQEAQIARYFRQLSPK